MRTLILLISPEGCMAGTCQLRHRQPLCRNHLRGKIAAVSAYLLPPQLRSHSTQTEDGVKAIICENSSLRCNRYVSFRVHTDSYLAVFDRLGHKTVNGTKCREYSAAWPHPAHHRAPQLRRLRDRGRSETLPRRATGRAFRHPLPYRRHRRCPEFRVGAGGIIYSWQEFSLYSCGPVRCLYVNDVPGRGLAHQALARLPAG